MAIIATGTLMLSLPISTTKPISLVNAIFTATSAACVTGLIVKETSLDFTYFGQGVILLMVQIGGLGYMTVATFMAIVLRRKLSHRDRIKKAVWFGLFHSVSFFNNAGFSLFSNLVEDYKFDPAVNLNSTTLIIIGGIEYFAILELYYFRQKKLTRISMHTKLTLSTTLILVVAAMFLFLSLEWFNHKSIGDFDIFGKLITGYFYAINLRTAGANSIDIGSLSDSTLFLSTIFMVIGGGASETAGGIKVTTFAVTVIATWHSIKGHSDTFVFKRTIPRHTVTQAFTILLVGTFISL